MIICHRKKFVILAPWKTASSTIHARLRAYSESPYSRFYDFNPNLNRVVHQHLVYADFAALPESKLGYFSASFIRNPYDRVYSGFRQLQKDINQQPFSPYSQPWIKALVMKQLSENFDTLCRAGFEFNTWLSLVDDHQFLDVGRNSSFPLHPAHSWTHLDGKQGVDFVGRVENFEQDFQELCVRIYVEPLEKINDNVDVEPIRLGPGSDNYKSAKLMNSASISRINDLFRADFDLFGYERI